MSPVLQVVLALASVAVLLGLMALVRRLADGYGMGPEVQRKMVHVGTGL
jgi:phytol kinase